MKKSNAAYKETGILALGELIVSLIAFGGFAIASLLLEVNFLSVILGLLLGSVVTVLNFFCLSFSVNRSVDKYLALRGNGEMTDEEAAAFTAKHSMEIQNAIKVSFIVRTVSMLVALVAAFLLMNVFNPIATVIPLLMYRPVLTIGELFRSKLNKAPDPSKFIVYDNSSDGYTEASDNATEELDGQE